MKILIPPLFFCLTAAMYGQTPQPGSQPRAGEQSRPADSTPTKPEAALDVQPGGPVIKEKDLWTQTGYFHPFVRMPKYMLQDQKAIWTSPFHTGRKDAKYWAIFGAVTAAFIATDKSTVKMLPNSSAQVSVSNWVSRIGSAYTLIPLSAGFYFIGTPMHADRFRETGLLCFETLIDANLLVEPIKMIADRARPLEGNGKGGFGDGPTRWSSGFPSGHAVNTWAMASVIAHQYPHPRYVPVIAYALASTVVISRVGARQHFSGDVVAGSAMGWFIGDYIYGRRHNGELDRKPTAAQKILDHIKLGIEIQ
jgi:membrane-associated phospholipid phosphatase